MYVKRRTLYFLTNFLYIVWSILLGVILFILIKNNYGYAKNIAISNAKTIVNKDLAYREWVASHGGVYVPVDKRTPPNPYLAHIKNRDFVVNGKKYTLMNPAYTLAQMMHDYSKLYGVKTHITSKKLLNPKNAPDAWERKALDEIEKTRKKYYEFSTIDDQEYLRLMNPLITKKGCLKCHGFQGYHVGDIRGGVSVSIPMSSLYKDALKSSMLDAALLGVVWLLGIIGITFYKKRISAYLAEKEGLYEEYIFGLVDIIEKRDTYTAGHSKRVAQYATLIAKKMGCSQENIDKLYRAGMLHDIGKIGIPDSIFLKPMQLSENEYALIQKHVEFGYDTLKDISIFDDIKDIIRSHHEHYDGSGYPKGLAKNDIPFLAQILTIADSFDAMTTDRIYKGRKDLEEAIEEITKVSGKQFNPEIVPYAIEALKEIGVLPFYQSPKTMLEKERFSYFYKDLLVGTFNEYYLRSQIYALKEYECAFYISLKNFHRYNKKYGWKKGDALLVSVANILHSIFKEDSSVYRFFGDRFFIACKKEQSFNDVQKLQDALDEILQGSEVEAIVKKSLLKNIEFTEVESLEEVIDKLFPS